MDEIELTKENLESLQNENISLKKELQLLKEKENSYQTSILRIKQIQNEYESSYKKYINDYKIHEEEIKQKYFEFQKILEKQNEENEKKLNEEIILLKNELKEKDNIIQSLKEKINSLNENIAQEELNSYFKEKEYEEIIISKERKLNELNDAIKQIVQEATEEIKRLSEQLEDFQNRTKMANPLSLLIEKEVIQNNINLNNINKNATKSTGNLNLNTNNLNNVELVKQDDINKQSQNIVNNNALLSEKFEINDVNIKSKINTNIHTPQRPNNSFVFNSRYTTKENPIYYTQKNYYNKNLPNQDVMTQMYLLENDKHLLLNELKQKEKEVNFWKNLRSDMYMNNQIKTGGINNSMAFSTNKYLNDIKLKNMEKTLANYGNKINKIKQQYDQSLQNHQREIDKLKNDMETSVNINQSKIKEGTLNTNNSYDDLDNIDNDNDNDNDSSEQKKSLNEDILHSLKITIPSKEGIRNEYINSQVEKIKNSENIDNNKE